MPNFLYPKRGHWLLTLLARILIKLTGWKIVGKFPNINKFVVIGFPHTSNWDFLPFMYVSYLFQLKISYFAKDSLFFFPLGFILKALGGIPIERKHHHGIVKKTISEFEKRESLVVGLMPEGTRNPEQGEWKRGFYFIAQGAGVPIVLGIIDLKRKAVHILEPFTPTNDEEADIQKLMEMAQQKLGL